MGLAKGVTFMSYKKIGTASLIIVLALSIELLREEAFSRIQLCLQKSGLSENFNLISSKFYAYPPPYPPPSGNKLFLPLILRQPEVINLTGNWSGQWMSYSGGGGVLNANIQQTGMQISGTISATGTFLGDTTGNLSGTISSNINGTGSITMVAWNNEGSVNFNFGSYSNTKISALYHASTGDYGTIVLTR
jgi:hypothetical protein